MFPADAEWTRVTGSLCFEASLFSNRTEFQGLTRSEQGAVAVVECARRRLYGLQYHLKNGLELQEAYVLKSLFSNRTEFQGLTRSEHGAVAVVECARRRLYGLQYHLKSKMELLSCRIYKVRLKLSKCCNQGANAYGAGKARCRCKARVYNEADIRVN
nr:hypothetical protein [Tanacetum cinerariifolium]